jgi:hypothetical protein
MTLNDVPQAAQTLADTQVPIQQNFQTIDAAFKINHVPYTLGTQGFHSKLDMPIQGDDPTSIGGEMVVYTKTSAVSGVPALFIRQQSSGTITELTTYGTGVYTFNNGPGSITYSYVWTRFPSGLLMLWGNQTSVGPNIPNTGLYFNYPTGGGQSFPGFQTSVFNVQLTLKNTNVNPLGNDNPLILVPTATPLVNFNVSIAIQWGATASLNFTAVGV